MYLAILLITPEETQRTSGVNDNFLASEVVLNIFAVKIDL